MQEKVLSRGIIGYRMPEEKVPAAMRCMLPVMTDNPNLTPDRDAQILVIEA
jgi:hypothetical protein